MIVSDVMIVSVTGFFLKRSHRTIKSGFRTLVSDVYKGSPLSQNILSTDRDDHKETLLWLFHQKRESIVPIEPAIASRLRD